MLQLTVGCYAETWNGQTIGPIVENKAANKEVYPFSARARLPMGDRESWCFWTDSGICSRTVDGSDPVLNIRRMWHQGHDVAEGPDETKIIIARPEACTHVPHTTHRTIVVKSPGWNPPGDHIPRHLRGEPDVEIETYGDTDLKGVSRKMREAMDKAFQEVARRSVLPGGPLVPNRAKTIDQHPYYRTPSGPFPTTRPCGEILLGEPQPGASFDEPQAEPAHPPPSRPRRDMDQMRLQDFRRGTDAVWSSFRLLP